MELFEKIKSIYAELSDLDFMPFVGTILLQNDSDGKGDYIKSWSHPTLAQPTQAQLNGVK